MNNVINEKNLTAIMHRIQSRRLELKLSYQDLAEKTNMSKSTLQRYETGSIKNMPIDKLSIIATALEVDPLWLLGFTLENTPEYTNEETILLNNFRKLNMMGKAKVISYTADLIDSKKYLKSESISITNKKNF